MTAFDRIPVPPAAVSRVLARFDRPALEGFIAVAIDLLDFADGDPDREDATDLEDDFKLSGRARLSAAHQPGCPVSDAGDISATEWHTRGRHKLSPGIIGRNGMPISEDVEDDDPDAEHDGREPDYG